MYDYIIVGSGIVGLSTAYHIKRVSPRSRVLVVDMFSAPAGGDTGRSAAAFRAFFSNPVNLLLADTSISYYESVQREGVDLGLMFLGYLFMLDRREHHKLKGGIKVAEDRGLEYRVLSGEELERLLGARVRVSSLEETEYMDVGDIEHGVFVPRAGILGAEKVADHYYRGTVSQGVEFRLGSRVESLLVEPERPVGIEGEPFIWQDSRVSGVVVEGGKVLRSRRKVVVAAGAWSYKLLNPIGVESYSRPKKRQVFVVKARREGLRRLLYSRGINREGYAPMMILPRRVYVRPEPGEEAFWIGASDELGRPFLLEENPVAEESFYVKGVLPLVSLYFPGFSGEYPSSMWAGHYDMSFDGLPVIFEPYESDLVVSCGTSGSGIMKADAIGRITAALALEESEAELYGGEYVKVELLGLKKRTREPELLII